MPVDKKILITGGAGFVGSNLAVLFRQKYHTARVVCLDNLKRRGSELNLKRLKQNGIEFVHGDIRNPEDLAIDGFEPDVIIECSAEPSVLAGFRSQPAYVVNTNLVGTINCLELARRSCADIIFLSTSRVYPIEKLNALDFVEGRTRFELTDSQPFPGASSRGISHNFPLDGYRSLYGATKFASEIILQEYLVMYGLRGVINRCGVIAGPWQMGKVDQGVFTLWMGYHYFRKPLVYIGYGGKGKQVRDLLHIEDLFRLIEWQMDNMDVVNKKVFNVGGGKETSLSLYETTMLCREITGNKISIGSEEKEREADVRIYISDISHVSEVTGWYPEKNPMDILLDIFNWIRTNEREIRYILFT